MLQIESNGTYENILIGHLVYHTGCVVATFYYCSCPSSPSEAIHLPFENDIAKVVDEFKRALRTRQAKCKADFLGGLINWEETRRLRYPHYQHLKLLQSDIAVS